MPAARRRGGCGLGALAGALLLAGCVTGAPVPQPVATSLMLPADCADIYRGLLDLAALARRRGPETDLFVFGLAELMDRLMTCLEAEAPPGFPRGGESRGALRTGHGVTPPPPLPTAPRHRHPRAG